MTAVTPTIQVLLDDGTGSFPIDITAQVSLSSLGVSGFGRSDEFSQAAAASLTLTLKNDDGRFTAAGPGFDTLPFGTGPFGGSVPVEPGLLVRFTETFGATTSVRFTGRISEITAGVDGGPAKAASVTLTCLDVLADLSRRPMRSMLEEEVLLDDPTAYYTLGEAEGSTSAGDTSGNAAPALTMTGTGTPVTFGQGTGPADGLTTATFAGGQHLANSLGPAAPGSYSELVAFSRASAPAVREVLVSTARELLVLETSGKVSLYSLASVIDFLLLASPVIQSASSVCDGAVHQAGWSVQQSTGFQLFTDGATTSAADVTAGTAAALEAGLHVGGSLVFVGTTPLTGNVSHVAHFDGTVLTSGQVSSIWNVIGGSETTDARLSRLASYAGMTATTTTPSGQLMGTQATTGQSLFDALQAVAAAEGGVLYADGSGVLRMQGRYYRSLKTTADLVVAGKDIDAGVTVAWDTQQKINQVTVTRTGGASQVISSAAVTANRNEPIYPGSLDLAVDTDANALYAAQWQLGKHSETQPRMASLTVNLITSTQAAALLGLKIGDRVTPVLPSQMYAGADYTIEGWTESLSVSAGSAAWTITFNLLPWDLAEVGIYDDAGSLYETAVYGY